MKKIFTCLMILLSLLLFAACGREPVEDLSALAPMDAAKAPALTQTFIDHLAAQEHTDAYALFSPAMRGAMSKAQLSQAWQQLSGLYGAYRSIDLEAATIDQVENNQRLVCPIQFDQSMYLLLSFNPKEQIDGFWVLAEPPAAIGQQTADVPEDVSETQVVILSQPEMPLSATLTRPAQGPCTSAVVFVHGSGPQDRDETIGANSPFRDLAWGLAQQGIASLRYDKVTYTYGAIGGEKITVDQETALDAVAAVRFLKEQQGIDPEKVFLLGHSQGAILGSYIESMGADAAGLILIAGTPEPIWRISERQNLDLIAALRQAGEEAQAQAAEEIVAENSARAERLLSMSDQEALDPDNAVFGLPAWYARHWAGIDPIALANEAGKPLLILHGEKDGQVDAHRATSAWKEGLSQELDVTYHLYPRLNHLLGEYQGEPVPIDQLVSVEYAQPTPVSQELIEDIAAWLAERS